MLMQPIIVTSNGPKEESGGAGGAIPWMCIVFIETDDITQTFVSNTIIVTGQNMTVTNFAEIAQQIEAAYGLPAGSIRITNIVIGGTTTNTGSGRRRRKLYRKKRQLPSCDQFGSGRSFVQITMRITYPGRCGVSSSCKRRFADGISTRFNTNAASFPVTFVFADGRTIQLVLSTCTATSGFSVFGVSSGGAGAASAVATTARAPVCSLQWTATGTTVAGVTNTAGTNANSLNTPRDVFLDTANTFVVADTTNNRIQRFVIGTNQGTTVAGQTGGAAGNGVTQLSGPEGVVVDVNNNIYVADTVNNRVQVWTLGTTQGSTVTGPSKVV
ncbi:unnamed protein product [Rotaria sordida]|uniref:NHL repeat containing protein n=1 Tax=Rotaria sordida TaxID=392033 RepID=A0A815CQ53_9BILA|nr:unnamed protein product [Rotaria sordida]